MSDVGFVGTTAVAGIGATEFSKASGRSEMQLACEATVAALEDAGIEPSEVDGMVTFTADTNPEIEIARLTGIGDLKFFSRIHHGGGAACGTVQQAAMAVAEWRSPTSSSSTGRSTSAPATASAPGSRTGRSPANAEASHFAWYAPFGLLTPAQWVAMFGRRYMHETGATSEDFGRVSVADRHHAANNPKAFFYEQPITLEDHQNSRWIVEPLHLLDCCQESDGGQALVVTSLERARDLKQPPAVIVGAAQGSGEDQQMMTSYYRDSITGIPEMGLVARQLYEQAGIGPDDIQTAVLYDHFTPVRALPARGVRLLRQGRGQGLRAGRPPGDGRAPAHQHPRRPAGRGLHPRRQRHRRGRPPGPGHLGQPGGRHRERARHRRHRRPHLRHRPPPRRA